MGRELEALDFYWFEELLPQADYAGYEILTDKLDIVNAARGRDLHAALLGRRSCRSGDLAPLGPPARCLLGAHH